MKKVMLFDFFGVICSEIAPFWLRRYFGEAEAVEIKADIVARGDLGSVGEEEMFSLISERCGIAPERIRTEWEEYISINESLVRYITELRDRAPIYLLSNAVAPILRRILEGYDLYRLFDGVYISSELRLAKPSPDYFLEVLSRIGSDAADAVMIDDNPQNIAGAVRAGIDGIVFESVGQLKESLEKFLR